jgi:chromosome segregation ATPase
MTSNQLNELISQQKTLEDRLLKMETNIQNLETQLKFKDNIIKSLIENSDSQKETFSALFKKYVQLEKNISNGSSFNDSHLPGY